MACRICFKDTETRNINLYVYGSEGLEVCHKCEMQIVEFVREMVIIAGDERKKRYIEKREMRKATKLSHKEKNVRVKKREKK